jgi:hypothetical protein
MVWPEAMVQMPPQHCPAPVQMSPFWTQYEEASWQRPFEQRPEQQSVFAAQRSPAMPLVQLEVELIFAQVPPVQTPPQHCPPVVQAWPVGVHPTVPQTPPVQVKLQQSVETVQVAPPGLHAPTPTPPAQVLVVVSQRTEQQSAFAPQGPPAAWQSPASGL